MGLDQYLYARNYFSPAAWRGEESNRKFTEIVKSAEAETLLSKEIPSAQVTISAAYWRKANAIHKWFVENCQNGEDDCREYPVSREQLRELADTCQKVLDDPRLAPELLPTQSGFFFGSTEYDDWYWEDTRNTVTVLNDLLENSPDEWDFYYQSSW